ncbi:MAG: RNA methyltransferase [Polyangiaceae bacterium]|nr:RNA methyltransferase [Polyangiaceae bacterium]
MRRTSPDAYEPAPELEVPWEGGWDAARVIAALSPWVSEERQAKIRAVVDARLESVTVVMDAPYDPHNGGAVIRSCDAFGVQCVHVIQRTDPFMVARRASRGSERWVDVHLYNASAPAIERLKASGRTLIATHPQGNLEPQDLADIPRLALVLGNEHAGISDDLVQASDNSVRIPMRGFVESLNMSVSAAILLGAASYGRKGDFSEASRETLFARGLFRSVARAQEVLTATQAAAKEKARTCP